MNTRLALLLAVLLVPLPGLAQENGAQLAADNAGDVTLYAQDGVAVGTPPDGAFTGLDLVAVGLAYETVDEVAFFVDVPGLEPSSGAVPFSDPRYEVYFTYDDVDYRANVALILDGPMATAFPDIKGHFASLSSWDGERWRTVSSADATVDFGTDRVTVIVPRGAIVNSVQAPLDKGSLITQVSARAYALGFSNGGGQLGPVQLKGDMPWAEDRAPDNGVGEDYELRTGKVLQDGQVFSFVPDPVRWTNGEASTFAYTVILTNQGSTDERVRITTEGVPSNWKASHADFVTVPAGGSVNASILMSIPFAHAHGSMLEFYAAFEGDSGFTKARLGVYWPAIPQPAGHHDTLWFHSRANAPDFPVFDVLFAGTQGWMNAAPPEVDTDDERIPVPAFVFGPPFSQGFTAFWQYSLSPGLRMGLDFDLDSLGEFATQVTASVPMVDPTMEVEVEWIQYKGGGGRLGGQGQNVERVIVAHGTSETLTGAQSGDLRFEVALQPTPEADLLPYDPTGTSNLVVRIAMQATAMAPAPFFGPDTIEPMMDVRATSMRLPLFEYHDSLDAPLSLDRELILMATETGQEKFVNPGKTSLYRFDLTYDGEFADDFEIVTTGHNTEWASIIGDTTIRLLPQETRTIALAVEAPSSALEGDEAHVTMVVRSLSNAAVEGAVHTLTKVTTTQDIRDESETAAILSGDLSQAQDSPGFGFVAVVAALAAIGVALRRK